MATTTTTIQAASSFTCLFYRPFSFSLLPCHTSINRTAAVEWKWGMEWNWNWNWKMEWWVPPLKGIKGMGGEGTRNNDNNVVQSINSRVVEFNRLLLLLLRFLLLLLVTVSKSSPSLLADVFHLASNQCTLSLSHTHRQLQFAIGNKSQHADKANNATYSGLLTKFTWQK